MLYNPNIHNRRSIRLKGYDYSQAGLYFITICCYNRKCLFGDVINGEMVLNEYGTIACNEWLNTPYIRKNVELDVFVIMPNHMHGIVIINEEPPIPTVATHSYASLQRKPRSLGSIIAGFKSVATKRINELRHTPSFPVWQRRFYDRVIRNDKELSNIRDYIHNNVFQWAIKRDDPDKIPLW